MHSVGPPEDAEYVNVFQWYRIVATEDPDPANPQQRYITVAGPDWNMNWCLNTSTYEVQAVLFDGISGVYTETVELD
ncbi:MAG: hypothetical protein HUU20_27735 [Pirellulales bacterium]|nr:hypothetical protein [Pirellulales bacterium]